MMFGQITGVPILDYHRLVPAGGSAIPGDRFAVHESEFRSQLQLLRDLGMTTVAPARHCVRSGA